MASGGTQSVESQNRARQLNFEKAMNDFKMMFPSIDVDVIEMVLRANNGLVDATVDQLLTMQDECQGSQNNESNLLDPSLNVRLPSYSDKGLTPHDPPPAYTPRVEENEQILYDPHDLLVHHIHTLKANLAAQKSQENSPPVTKNKDWNPPLLGSLPNDFLRLNVSPPSPQTNNSSTWESPRESPETSNYPENTQQTSTTNNHDVFNTPLSRTDDGPFNGLDSTSEMKPKSGAVDKGKSKRFGHMSRKFKRKKTKSNKKEYQQMSSDGLVDDDSGEEGEGVVPR